MPTGRWRFKGWRSGWRSGKRLRFLESQHVLPWQADGVGSRGSATPARSKGGGLFFLNNSDYGVVGRYLGLWRALVLFSKAKANFSRVGSLKALPMKVMATGRSKAKPAGAVVGG